ncbi:MAG: hypothetical protein ACSHWU_08270 [Marinicella sp.]
MKKINLVLIALLTSSIAAAGEQRFGLLNDLAGHCYQASFPDGEKIDTHCFSEKYNGAFIVDDHVVCGKGEPYYGETWYAAEGENKAVKFRYFNSLGGVSEGPVSFQESQIVFPEEKYRSGSEETTYKTVWTVAEKQYTSDMVQLQESKWQPVWQMLFKQVDWEEQQVVTRDDALNLRCL